ncbi:hypothetical protein DB347_18800 [Opitutaceae bacterium EW11]|nr:hypothetical protein DB347_18800 [Opitutaceae bacterium EW11]
MRLLHFVPIFASLAAIAGASAGPELQAALKLYEQKNYEAARTSLEALRQKEPENAEVLFRLGQACLQTKRPDEAVRWLEEASRLAPANADYLAELGNAYGDVANARSSLEAASRARETLERAVALDPKNENARAARIAFLRKAPAIAGGGIEKAFQQANELCALNPLAGAFQLVLLHEQQKDFDTAFSVCAEALRKHPDDYRLLFSKGRVAVRARAHLDEGVAALSRCLELPTPPDGPSHARVQVELGRLYLLKSQPAEARRHFQDALAEEPGNPQAQAGIDALAAVKPNAG